jgi:hypothetical protein
VVEVLVGKVLPRVDLARIGKVVEVMILAVVVATEVVVIVQVDLVKIREIQVEILVHPVVLDHVCLGFWPISQRREGD